MTAINYEYIKAEAKRRRKDGESCSVEDLIALATKNDPFYTGTPSEVKKARWFAKIWQRFGYRHGVHLRRIHYQIVSQEEAVLLPDGKPYENTEKCWGYLNGASKYARYLELVPAGAFVDRRNPDAVRNARWASESTLTPTVSGSFYDGVTIPSVDISGAEGHGQPCLIEVWVEKTTMNDILKPLCGQYDANLVTGAGELSITAVLGLLQRVQDLGKPARLLYVSDFDPAGLDMPISVARKIEYFQRSRGYDRLDVTLEPIALTSSQVQAYRLPRVPVKDADKRKAGFEEAFGEGQVELDALEALHPGALAEIVEDAISNYYDHELELRIREKRAEVRKPLLEARRDLVARYSDRIAELEKAMREIQSEIREGLQAEIDALDPRDLELPTGTVSEPDGKLYESGRGYFEQLDYYKLHKGEAI